jgi:hypothetical protein
MKQFHLDLMNNTAFSIDSENVEFYLLYLGYNLPEINEMQYNKGIRMSKRIQSIIKLGSLHSYIGALSNTTPIHNKPTNSYKSPYPANWRREYSVNFDISDVIIE